MAKSFEDLLFEAALNAVRTLPLEELFENWAYIRQLDVDDDIKEFPLALLAIAIKEKELQRQLN